MDIEQLSKSQTVLLTLLVSFITSIATGIVTVSLMDQAPPAIAQTVNRVIERTVEAAAPVAQTASTVVTQQKTVVVQESDLVAQAVASVSPAVVRLYTSDGGAGTAPTFLGLGVVLDASGTVATDAGALGESADANIILPDGTSVRAFVTSRDTLAEIAYLTPATSTEQKPVSWHAAPIGTKTPVLGQSVVALSGETVARIGDGLISAITPGVSGATSGLIDTDIPDSAVMPGSPLIDTNGNVIGISTGASRASSPSGFVPAAALTPPGK